MTVRRTVNVLLASIVIVSGACSSSPAPIEIAPDTSPVTLAPGDSIRIAVWRYEQYSGVFGVGTDGAIAHPLYQGVRATDIPLSGLDAAVTDVLREYIDEPNVVVEPLFQVTVVGTVITPGTYAMHPATTLVQAVARAGGPGVNAKTNAVVLLREEPGRGIVKQELDLTDPSNLAFRETIRSGDQIVVRTKTWTTGLFIALVGAAAAVLLVIERFSD